MLVLYFHKGKYVSFPLHGWHCGGQVVAPKGEKMVPLHVYNIYHKKTHMTATSFVVYLWITLAHNNAIVACRTHLIVLLSDRGRIFAYYY